MPAIELFVAALSLLSCAAAKLLELLAALSKHPCSKSFARKASYPWARLRTLKTTGSQESIASLDVGAASFRLSLPLLFNKKILLAI